MRIWQGKVAAAAIVLGAFTAASAAQAAVVCNSDGDCWHARETYTYPPAAGIVVHPDAWRWEGDRYRWREHEGRGYWHGHDWTDF